MAAAPILPPDMPPDSPEEAADKQQMIRMMQEISRELHQRNLTNAVALAQQALRGHGPLVDHFAELGRRYGHLLQAPQRPGLRVVEGGRD